MVTEIKISLISHTNIGKTSLARTLLREDIGQVQDRAHTTMECQERELINKGTSRLMLWDTPGFGGANALNIAARIKESGSARGWLLHQVVDRISNKSLYSSVEAAKNIRLNSHVVVYLVDNRCSPSGTGYLKGELTLLQALGKPVILILNHVDGAGVPLSSTLSLWKTAVKEFDVVKGITVLDAHSRVWFQELELLKLIEQTLEPALKAVMQELISEYQQQQHQIEKRCMTTISKLLVFAVKQRVENTEKLDNKEIFRRLYLPLDGRFQETLKEMVAAYHLDYKKSPDLKADISMLSGKIIKKIPEKATGLISGAVAGAGGGLAADLMAGGLSFGGGALLGFIIGGLTGIAAAKGINVLIRNDGEGRWSNEYFIKLLNQCFLFYLLICHHGRGKGILDLDAEVKSWQGVTEQIINQRKTELLEIFSGEIDEESLFSSVLKIHKTIMERIYSV